jgi:hypothetical protein
MDLRVFDRLNNQTISDSILLNMDRDTILIASPFKLKGPQEAARRNE